MKIDTPKLRKILVAIAVTAVLLFALLHNERRRELANQRSTGLGIATESSNAPPRAAVRSGPGIGGGIAGGIIGGVPGGLPTARPLPKLVEANQQTYTAKDAQGGGGGGGQDQLETKKLIRTVSLNLLVKDARAASFQVQQIAKKMDGDVERAELRDVADASRSGEITLRVPAKQLEVVVDKLRHLSLRVQTEHWDSNDVTREFFDSEARLRNMKAEEQQYLVLLRRAGSMKDTLQVTEKISEVRGEIEQLQGELNWISHQVAMSAIHVSLSEEPQAVVAAQWRPLYNARHNAHEMLLGLGEWVDWVVAFVIDLPLILVWLCSIGIALWVAWRILRFIWLRWLKPQPSPEPVAAS